jgi:hypothetical protein
VPRSRRAQRDRSARERTPGLSERRLAFDTATVRGRCIGASPHAEGNFASAIVNFDGTLDTSFGDGVGHELIQMAPFAPPPRLSSERMTRSMGRATGLPAA